MITAQSAESTIVGSGETLHPDNTGGGKVIQITTCGDWTLTVEVRCNNRTAGSTKLRVPSAVPSYLAIILCCTVLEYTECSEMFCRHRLRLQSLILEFHNDAQVRPHRRAGQLDPRRITLQLPGR